LVETVNRQRRAIGTGTVVGIVRCSRVHAAYFNMLHEASKTRHIKSHKLHRPTAHGESTELGTGNLQLVPLAAFPSPLLPSHWKRIKYAQINKNENSKRSARSRKENGAKKNIKK